MMKKETLEEAAERYDSDRDSFIAGAKYMAERMYSRQDLIYFIYFINDRHFNKFIVDTDEVDLFIEQFKKK